MPNDRMMFGDRNFGETFETRAALAAAPPPPVISPTVAGPMTYVDDREDAWQPGTIQATNIYNQGQVPLDFSMMDQTAQNLLALQNPMQNPYLMDMLSAGQQSIADQTLSSLGLSGRAPGTINPMTGMASDSAINMIDNLGNFTTDFLGNQYQQDMNRALQAAVAGGDYMTNLETLRANEPWRNLNNYTNVVSSLTGTSPIQQERQRTSGWDKLIGLGTVAGGLLGSGGLSSIL